MSAWVLPDDAALNAIEERLPASREDQRILAISEERLHRLRAWLKEQGLGGVLLSRRDNFAWLTGGGESHVLKDTELGTGHLLITPGEQFLLAYTMDAERLVTEHMPGQPFEPVTTQWHEADPRSLAFQRVKGRLAVDATLTGADERGEEIMRLHGSLAGFELDRLRWLGRMTGLLLEAAGQWVLPGMTEQQIGWMITAEFALQQIAVEVVIVGSDDRLRRIWHATPSAKPIRQHLSMHAAARRWGLHAPVQRQVSFGNPPEWVSRAYAAALQVEASVLAALQPGQRYAQILEIQKAAYAATGCPDEWQKHFQGGPTGYFIGDGTRCWTDLAVEPDTAFDWFQTVDGIQVEELTLLTANGVELASLGSEWPVVELPSGDQRLTLPDLLVR